MGKTGGCVYLVGAGCGTADLITVRGLELLRQCDAVVCDDLLDPALLEEIPPGAETYYMGKRCGGHSASQSEISARLIQLAEAGKTVVRLKGGDPFVFGRGGEELLALRAAGIPCEAVPGISSAIAIPAQAGIPVTHRGVSRSVHIITAHTAAAEDFPARLRQLAGCSGTLVFLMGVTALEEIARGLITAGMGADTPAAVVSGGSAPRQQAIRGTLGDIAERAAGAQAPAVIVVGAVAAMELTSTIPKPLQGIRIALTGTAEITQKLSASLRTLGGRVFLAERSLVEELPLSFDLHTLEDGRPCWVVLTSGNAVRIFFRRLREQRVDLRNLRACRFAVLGQATAEVLAEHGILADLCPTVFTSAGLARALGDRLTPEDRVFLFRSRLGSRSLYETLSRCCRVEDIPLYDLRPDAALAERCRPLLAEADCLVFSSGSGVDFYFRQQGAVPEKTTCVCIGPVTAAALRQWYHRPFLTAAEISADGIVQAICRAFPPAGTAVSAL